jgi:hypothetical protein
MQFPLTAVRTFTFCRKVALKWQAAALAKRWSDVTHLRPAFRADKAVFGVARSFFAKLANFRVEKIDAGVEPAFDR